MKVLSVLGLLFIAFCVFSVLTSNKKNEYRGGNGYIVKNVKTKRPKIYPAPQSLRKK